MVGFAGEGLDGTIRLLAVLALLVSASCLGSEPIVESSRSDCESLRDHLVEISLATAAGVNQPTDRVKRQLDRHRQNLRAAYGDRFVTDCQLRRPRAWIDCALDAASKEELRLCESR
jgi:hypothetical protein